jgi:hypothetical protein
MTIFKKDDETYTYDSLVASPSFSCLNLTKKRKEKNKRQERVWDRSKQVI